MRLATRIVIPTFGIISMMPNFLGDYPRFPCHPDTTFSMIN